MALLLVLVLIVQVPFSFSQLDTSKWLQILADLYNDFVRFQGALIPVAQAKLMAAKAIGEKLTPPVCFRLP